MEPINYARIAMSDIDPEARRIALAWMEGFEDWMKTDIAHKVKLASDIMNYAIAYHNHHTKQTGTNTLVMRSLPDANPHQCALCGWGCTCSDQPCSCCSVNETFKSLDK